MLAMSWQPPNVNSQVRWEEVGSGVPGKRLSADRSPKQKDMVGKGRRSIVAGPVSRWLPLQWLSIYFTISPFHFPTHLQFNFKYFPFIEYFSMKATLFGNHVTFSESLLPKWEIYLINICTKIVFSAFFGSNGLFNLRAAIILIFCATHSVKWLSPAAPPRTKGLPASSWGGYRPEAAWSKAFSTINKQIYHSNDQDNSHDYCHLICFT